MGLRQALRALVGRPVWAEVVAEIEAHEKSNMPPLSPTLPTGVLLDLIRLGSIPRKGTAELMVAYRNSPWLRGVVGRIAQGVATQFEPVMWAGTGKKRKQLDEHPFLDFIKNPCPALNPVSVRQITQLHHDLCGNAFSVLERNGFGLTIEQWPVAPHWITRTPFRGWDNFGLSLYGGYKVVPSQDMIWLRDPDPSDPYQRGTGIGEAMSDTIDSAEYSEKFIKSFFVNHGLPDSLVTMKESTSAEVQRFEQSMNQQYAGPERSHRVHFTNLELDVKRLDTNFKDSDLVAMQKWFRDIVVQVWGVPPEIFGILQSSTRSSIEAAEYLFCKLVTVPRLKFLVAEYNRTIVPQYAAAFPEYGKSIELGFVNPIPEDREFFIKAVATAPSCVYVGEVRERMGLPPSPIDEERLGFHQEVPAGPSAPGPTPEPKPATPTQLPSGKANGDLAGLFGQKPSLPLVGT